MDTKSTTRAFQKILPSWNFDKSSNWAEEFAIKRFLKKMELPDQSRKETRRSECWERWISNDCDLPSIQLPSSEWYKAREIIHQWFSSWRLGPVEFSNGSEFIPTRGKNSIEAKLSASKWTCTRDNWENFSRTCYRHKALKRAVKRRFTSYVTSQGFNLRSVNGVIFDRFKTERDAPYRCFQAKLSFLTTFTHGARFSTVPKNNEKDRPINIEPFGNILFQKRVGNGIRTVLADQGIDLNHLPDKHRVMISDLSYSTIDLSDASDSISVSLVRFLFPRRILQYLESSRSDMVLGLDGNYHVTKKISSMGNGFTFELMTAILTALCKVLDDTSSVFGDDIVIKADKSSRLIQLLTEVGLKVNTDKSCLDGPFRESCGANWHQDFGYVKSFDFKYPENVHDCVVLYNKAHALGRDPLYPSFRKLEQTLRRTIPPALRGVWTEYDSLESELSSVTGASSFLSGYFRLPVERGRTEVPLKRFRQNVRDLCYNKITSSFYGFAFENVLRTPCYRHIPARYWAKYEMYLYSNRRCKDTISGEGVWSRKLMFVLDNEMIIGASQLKRTVK